MSQHDTFDHGPPPADLTEAEFAFGAVAFTRDGQPGIRVMLKNFRVIADRHGDPVAVVEIKASSAVQAVQCIRQAITDARRGVFR